MMRVPYTVGAGVLLPDGDEARQQLAKLTAGEVVGVEITRPRDPKFNSFVHLTIERTAAAMGVTVRACRGWLLIRTGRATVVQWASATTVVPDTVGDMNAVEFEAFWEDASALIARDVLPYLTADDASDIGRRLAVIPPVDEQQPAASA
jgi:hypothetical protein